MPDMIARAVMQPTTPLGADELVGEAVRKVIVSRLPALPAVEANGDFAGVFGARELLVAIFPGYVIELGSSAMIPSTVDQVLERRLGCLEEPIRPYLNTDHVVVEGDFSDIQMAELFLHHRVDIIPISAGGRISAAVSSGAFFRGLADRLHLLSKEDPRA